VPQMSDNTRRSSRAETLLFCVFIVKSTPLLKKRSQRTIINEAIQMRFLAIFLRHCNIR
jgi:hypothetical protein